MIWNGRHQSDIFGEGKPTTLLKVTLPNGCFSCFLNCINCPKFRRASHTRSVTSGIRIILFSEKTLVKSWYTSNAMWELAYCETRFSGGWICENRVSQKIVLMYELTKNVVISCQLQDYARLEIFFYRSWGHMLYIFLVYFPAILRS